MLLIPLDDAVEPVVAVAGGAVRGRSLRPVVDDPTECGRFGKSDPSDPTLVPREDAGLVDLAVRPPRLDLEREYGLAVRDDVGELLIDSSGIDASEIPSIVAGG